MTKLIGEGLPVLKWVFSDQRCIVMGRFYFSYKQLKNDVFTTTSIFTDLPSKCDSDVMFRLQSYQGLIIDRTIAY